MTDRWFAPDSRLPPNVPAKRRHEQLFTIERGDGATVAYELVDHGEFGFEVQITHNGELALGRRFDTRELAVQWAEEHKNLGTHS